MNNNSIDNEFVNKKNNAEGYDLTRLSALGRSAIGTRTVKEFCEKTGLSKSFVSRLINGTLNRAPTKRSIYRFAGPDSEPQNGVTVKDMLLAAGYSQDEHELLYDTNTQETSFKSMSIADSIALYYSQSPSFGISIFLNALIEKRYCDRCAIEFQLGLFCIKLEEYNLNLVVVPAFCAEERGLMAVKSSALQRVVMSVALFSDRDQSQMLFFVITDREELYDELQQIPTLPDMRLAILLTEDGIGFSEQYIVPSIGLDSSDVEGRAQNFPINLV